MSAPGTPSSPERTAARRIAVRTRLRSDGLDALLVTDLTDIRYLSGFTGSNAALWVSANDDNVAVLCTDNRYEVQARSEAPTLHIQIERACAAALIEQAGRQRIGFDENVVTVAQHRQFAHAAGPGAELIANDGGIDALRQVKDASEIDSLRTACHIADAALAGLLAAGGLRAGFTERDVAMDLDDRMRRLESEGVSFPTILAAGENSAIPHHQPTDRPLRVGDLVKIDFGAVIDGYHSDMTRTVVLGSPATWQVELHAVVLEAQRAGRDSMRPGVSARTVDAAARDVIAQAGYGDSFGHGLGHGVGLDVHEAPWLGPRAAGIMAEDMTVTVEPGVYLPGSGGVRIEDCGIIGPDGYEPLTLAPRDLAVW